MTDTFKTHTRSLTSPPESGETIAPSDSSDLEHVTRALYIGGAGDLTVRMKSGSLVTLANVQAGTFLPLRVQQVQENGTTATGIVGFW